MSSSSWSGLATRSARLRCAPPVVPLVSNASLTPRADARLIMSLCAPRADGGRCAEAPALRPDLTQHAHLIQHAAASLARRSFTLNEQELAQYGHIALLELAQRYDAQRITPALIWQRVRGSMIDACRREGWSARRDQRRVGPRRYVELVEPASLDERQDDAPRRDPLATAQLSAVLRDAMLDLPEQDRKLILLHDLEEVPLRDLAQAMRRAPSRLSHRRREALDALRGALAARGVRSCSDLI